MSHRFVCINLGKRVWKRKRINLCWILYINYIHRMGHIPSKYSLEQVWHPVVDWVKHLTKGNTFSVHYESIEWRKWMKHVLLTRKAFGSFLNYLTMIFWYGCSNAKVATSWHLRKSYRKKPKSVRTKTVWQFIFDKDHEKSSVQNRKMRPLRNRFPFGGSSFFHISEQNCHWIDVVISDKFWQ